MPTPSPINIGESPPPQQPNDNSLDANARAFAATMALLHAARANQPIEATIAANPRTTADEPLTELEEIIATPTATIQTLPPRSKKTPVKKAPAKPKAQAKPAPPTITDEQVACGAKILKALSLLELAKKLDTKPSTFVSTYIRSKLQGAHLNVTFNQPITNYREACAQASVVPPPPPEPVRPMSLTILSQHMQQISHSLQTNSSRVFHLEVQTPEQIEQFRPIREYLAGSHTISGYTDYVNFSESSAISIPASDIIIRIPVRALAQANQPIIIDRFRSFSESEIPNQPYRLLKAIEVPEITLLHAAIKTFTNDVNMSRNTPAPAILPLMLTLLKRLAFSASTITNPDFNRAVQEYAPDLTLHIGITNTPRARARISATV